MEHKEQEINRLASDIYSMIRTIPMSRALASMLYGEGYRKIPADIGQFSDGYHTFNELYHHRAILFSVICNSMPDKAWKSKLHDTGDMFEGMFIVGIETPEGQATYHYDIEPYWDMFKVKELEKAPKWDGHTPQDAIDRIAKLSFVTRCIHCKRSELTMKNGTCYCYKHHRTVDYNDYCSGGERRANDDH